MGILLSLVWLLLGSLLSLGPQYSLLRGSILLSSLGQKDGKVPASLSGRLRNFAMATHPTGTYTLHVQIHLLTALKSGKSPLQILI